MEDPGNRVPLRLFLFIPCGRQHVDLSSLQLPHDIGPSLTPFDLYVQTKDMPMRSTCSFSGVVRMLAPTDDYIRDYRFSAATQS
jgi:hypothetical protein